MNFAEFEILEHPADVGFRAYGRTREELFANCARALVSLILDPSEIVLTEEWTVNAEGSDDESMLVNWLNEVLFYVDTRRLAFGSFTVSFPAPGRVACIAQGERWETSRHPVRVSVKAVTYHQLRVFQSAEHWTAEVFVDV
jgi:SHS2 domain-containing protein